MTVLLHVLWLSGVWHSFTPHGHMEELLYSIVTQTRYTVPRSLDTALHTTGHPGTAHDPVTEGEAVCSQHQLCHQYGLRGGGCGAA